MHTVLLNETTKHPEWQLFHPFFYTQESNGQLTTISYGQQDGFAALFDRVYKEITETRADEWQLVVLLHMDYPLKLHERLAVRLEELKQGLVAPLKKREAAPKSVVLLVMDALLHEDTTDTESRIAVQLDEEGFVTGDFIDRPANVWSQHDLAELDEAWGERVKADHIGLLEKPHQSFLDELTSRMEKVKRTFLKLQEKKNILYDGSGYLDPYTGRYALMIETLFTTYLEEEIRPPLNSDITSFYPSQTLRNVLSDTVSITHGITDIAVIRQSMPRFAKDKKYEKWLEAAAFLQVLVQDPAVINGSLKGQCHYLDAKINQENMNEMFSKYRKALEFTKERLENALYNRTEMMMKRYEKDLALPKSAEDLPELQVPMPAFTPKEKHTLLNRWYGAAKKAKDRFTSREEDMQQSARSGIDIVKRHQLRELVTQDETVPIHHYLKEIETSKKDVLLELEKHVPPPSTVVRRWEEFTEKTGNPLGVSLDAYPEKRKQVLTGITLWFFLAVPLIYSLTAQGNVPTLTDWGQYILIILLAGAVMVISHVAVRYMTLPVSEAVAETEKVKHDLVQDQMTRHSDTNHYLNHIYKLERLHREEKAVRAELEKKQLANQLDHFHLRELNVALDALIHLENHLHIQKSENAHRDALIQLVSDSFHKHEDVIDSAIYSPVKCAEAGNDTFYSTKVSVGRTVRQVELGKWKLLDEVKIQKDKVLHVWN
ncbi:hypothetical protein JSY36_17510 [Bacillus sp. H-16]|uniref:hypothetical protein n=1 Tax=Alteribacter salitolerans TaxID=2912333 RepID=UPI0019624414|nr:hypothetical protein [Alteribacter salitolerans]MBM7097534.1 hypothetical protein [Alteribacter salitolerans]